MLKQRSLVSIELSNMDFIFFSTFLLFKSMSNIFLKQIIAYFWNSHCIDFQYSYAKTPTIFPFNQIHSFDFSFENSVLLWLSFTLVKCQYDLFQKQEREFSYISQNYNVKSNPPPFSQ